MPTSFRSNEYKNMVRCLKDARLEMKLTQIEVAKKLHKPQSYVSKAEKGERRIDAIELARFAKIYRKNINFFLN